MPRPRKATKKRHAQSRQTRVLRPSRAAVAKIPSAPDAKTLERAPNPHADANYAVRFAAPEFTSICPITGQPDFAHLVIDYVPDRWIVSRSR